MDITPLIRRDAQVIQSYRTGAIKVSGVSFTGPVLVRPQTTTSWDGQIETLLAILPADVELVLLGTGERITPLTESDRMKFRTRGIGVEVMDTGAACRTYNVLLAEGRMVAAALWQNAPIG